MRNSFLLSFFAFILVSSWGCNDNVHFSETVNIPDAGWSYSDKVDFEVSIEDTSKVYELDLSITHAPDYPFQNCYLMISTELPSGESFKKRINVDFANKAGVWLGECSKKVCKFNVNLQQSAYFNEAGIHKFSFAQYMRQDPLESIRAIKFTIKDTGRVR